MGKTTLAAALARDAEAVVIGELDARAAPPVSESAEWFVNRTVERWTQAREAAGDAPIVVLDGDVFKGLWYNPVFAEEGWPGIGILAPLYRREIERGRLGFPNHYVALDASVDVLRARRAGDPTRSRRNFEKHLRLVEPLRAYFDALGRADPGRVLVVDTVAHAAAALQIVSRIAHPMADGVSELDLFDRMVDWAMANIR